ncbi:MAG: putative DNA-binding domain-containing protein [Halioglobus sp.]|nr:putative DNA-binding domain-containing protein [Halioglobus sp.]
MAEASFQESQLTMARYLRDPGHQPPPSGVEARRLKIYEELIYNNIEGFISGGFPVLRSLYNEAEWQGLVRAFIDQHRCQTPYFLQISEEFLEFLLNNFEARPCDPPFIAELAHYEWVELALDVSEEEVPSAAVVTDVLGIVPRLSPLAWPLSYQFPVHRIGPGFKPTEAAEPVYLLVYRTSEDDVRFMELNVTTARLLEMIRVNDGATARDLLARLAGELDMAEDAVLAFGAEQLTQLIDQSVVVA